jgi:hypothetical protein
MLAILQCADLIHCKTVNVVHGFEDFSVGMLTVK